MKIGKTEYSKSRVAEIFAAAWGGGAGAYLVYGHYGSGIASFIAGAIALGMSIYWELKGE